MTKHPASDDEHEPKLRRVMGPWLLLLFIIGDILGTGIYALTGQVAKHVGGAVWLPFLAAFGVALLTAFSYLELVTKYPKAAGAGADGPQANGDNDQETRQLHAGQDHVDLHAFADAAEIDCRHRRHEDQADERHAPTAEPEPQRV